MPTWLHWPIVLIGVCALCGLAVFLAGVLQEWRRGRRVRSWIDFGMSREEAERAADWLP